MLAALYIILITCMMSVPAEAQNVFEKSLTSVRDNIHVELWETTSGEITPACPADWSIRKYILHGGKQEGVDIIEIDNGELTITVIPTRGMGILKVVRGDVRLGWDSPVKEVVHPMYIDLERRGGSGMLDGFNEFLMRCGLEFAGDPGVDTYLDFYEQEAELDLTLHGKIQNIPASEVIVSIDKNPPYRISLRGRVDERMFFGPNYELWTEISTEPGSSSFRTDDVITNQDAKEHEFQILYHCNYGPPLLEKGARFVAPIKRATPANDLTAKRLAHIPDYLDPSPENTQEEFNIQMYGDDRGMTTVMLHNAEADRAATMTFSVEQLPYFILWKNMGPVESGYITGLEPGTGFAQNRRTQRHFGRVPVLGAGEKRRFTIDYEILTNTADIKTVEEKIKRIQDGRKTLIDKQPDTMN